VVFFFLATTTRAKSYSLLAVTDQASDGNFCNSIYTCSLSDQELSNLSTQDNQGYQIKDHTGIFTNGAWPQIYFAPDRYLEFEFGNLNLSATDTILSSSFVISHQVNQAQGLIGQDHDIKLEASKDGGSTWETLSTNIWPATSGSFAYFQVSLPASYLNYTSLNNLLTRLSIYGDDGYANLFSIIDLIKLDIDYYNSLTNTPPVNTISAPSENQQLKGDITFTVSLTDDFGITEYQLNLLDENQNLITTCLQATISSTTSLSASCQIDSTSYPNGQYYLQIKTKDNAEEWTTSTRLVLFDNASPITDLLSILPQDNTFWQDSITISGSSEDNLTTSFVDLYLKESNTTNPWTNLTTLVNSVTSSIFNWSYSWQPTEEKSYNLAASATDLAGNQESLQVISQDVAYVPSLFPIISNQLGTTPTLGEITISWSTQLPTSGRVVYDTVSHPTPDTFDSNYGYVFSSNTINLSPQAVSHSVTLTGLSDNTIYYYRIISTSLPTTIGQELTNKTLSMPGPGGNPTSNSPPQAVITQNTVSSLSITQTSVILNSIQDLKTPVGSRNVVEDSSKVAEVDKVLGQTTTEKPKTWMLVLSIIISSSYLLYLLSRRRKI
jgi:hypothetical protein